MDSSMPWFLFFMVKTMQSWIEMDYDRGLAMLKDVAETGQVNATTTNEGIVDFTGFDYIGLKRTVHIDDMSTVMAADFKQILKDVVETHGRSAQHWVTLYPKVNMKTKMFTYIAAVSNEGLLDLDLGSDYVSGSISTGKIIKISHRGSYRFMGNPWAMGMMYVRGKKLKQKGFPFEYYHNSPYEVPEEELLTDVCFPLR